MSESKIPSVPEVVLSAETDAPVNNLTTEEFLEMKLLQEKVVGAQKDVTIAQQNVINAQLKVELAGKNQAEYMKEKLWGKYNLQDGDMINIADGSIMRKGDPNLTIGRKPQLSAVPPPAVLG